MAAPAPDPASPLGRYRRLSPTAGVYVSPVQLGAMSLGSKWAHVGSCTKDAAFAHLDAYFGAGGNVIDTANAYQDGESEAWIGEWMEARNVRDQVVVATKYTGCTGYWDPRVQQKATLLGNSAKSLRVSVEASLKALHTAYIDILYVHWWDWTTSVEELMDALHALVAAGKVLYLGVSNTPAWVVSKANQYARDHGHPQFVIYQGEWNVLKRDVERDILPMCRAEGMAFAPWNVLCAGRLRTDAEEAARAASGSNGRTGFAADWKRTDAEKKMVAVLEGIAQEVNAADIRAVLIAYHLQKQPYVFPLVGGNKPAQLLATAAGIALTLTPAHIAAIEAAAPFDAGFPHTYIGDGSMPNVNNRAAIVIDVEPFAAPIRVPALASALSAAEEEKSDAEEQQ